MTPARREHRLAFARTYLGDSIELEPASSDASFRSYWRTLGHDPSRIVMDAPPDKEDLGPWLAIAERLRGGGIEAPEVLAADRERGFLLLSDLGRDLLLPALNSETVEHWYRIGLNTLLQMQSSVAAHELPAYDEARLVAEMELLPTWLLQRHLGFTPECEQWDLIERAFRHLLDAAAEQPRVFVHRDYHSRNLMRLTDGRLGVIDFQDAVHGPIAYDLVSLLRDCYIAWPDSQVYAWVEGYRRQAVAAGLTDASRERFARWFDLIGLQRHIKVLGIFCRLYYRDGKAGYLGDLPLVWAYTRRIGRRYPTIAPLIELLEQAIGGRDLTRADAAADAASCVR